MNDEETIEGVILVGAPLFDSLGRIFAAISVSAPTVRCSSKKRREMIEQVLTTSHAITKDLYDAAFRAREHDI
jgi:DNA-binding IclR family transcriptional regulator